MKLLIIRHGDPDYGHDCLTPAGKEEARLLARWLEQQDVTAIFSSPLGRAKETADITAAKKAMDVTVLPWLREFPAKLRYWETEALKEACPCPWATSFFDRERVMWDILPSYWTADPDFYHPTNWRRTEPCAHSDMTEVYDRVTGEFDAFLAACGYLREGNLYRAERPNEDTVILFCHFGVECVILGHILNISPMQLWQGTCAAPSSVTVLRTEERREGIAYFRMSTFGDTSHLYAGGMEPAFSARFCETYANESQRHD